MDRFQGGEDSHETLYEADFLILKISFIYP